MLIILNFQIIWCKNVYHCLFFQIFKVEKKDSVNHDSMYRIDSSGVNGCHIIFSNPQTDDTSRNCTQ